MNKKYRITVFDIGDGFKVKNICDKYGNGLQFRFNDKGECYQALTIGMPIANLVKELMDAYYK